MDQNGAFAIAAVAWRNGAEIIEIKTAVDWNFS